jgi:hypothetical protein
MTGSSRATTVLIIVLVFLAAAHRIRTLIDLPALQQGDEYENDAIRADNDRETRGYEPEPVTTRAGKPVHERHDRELSKTRRDVKKDLARKSVGLCQNMASQDKRKRVAVLVPYLQPRWDLFQAKIPDMAIEAELGLGNQSRHGERCRGEVRQQDEDVVLPKAVRHEPARVEPHSQYHRRNEPSHYPDDKIPRPPCHRVVVVWPRPCGDDGNRRRSHLADET